MAREADRRKGAELGGAPMVAGGEAVDPGRGTAGLGLVSGGKSGGGSEDAQGARNWRGVRPGMAGVATARLFSSSRKSGRKKKEARRERRTRHREKEIRPGLMSVYPIAAEAGAWH